MFEQERGSIKQVDVEPVDVLKTDIKQVEAGVLNNFEMKPGYFRMTLQAHGAFDNACAGQFVHLLPRAPETFDPLLRRAFSILNVNAEGLEILYRVGGKGTQNMAKLRRGDKVDIIGPLGNGFNDGFTNDGFIDESEHAILVGGGVGVPPLVMLASQRNRVVNSVTEVLIGARSENDVLCVDDFEKMNLVPFIATEDGSVGTKGYVTELLKDKLNGATGKKTVFACGPWPMLRAVALMCAEYAVACQVSMEESMPCGLGVCNGCVVQMLGGDDEYSKYRRICVEGPVLWAHEVAWDK